MRYAGWVKGFLACALVTGVAAQAPAAELAKYTVKDGAIAQSLTGKPGDPFNGRVVAVTKGKGHCVACHKMPAPDISFHGTAGPDLAGVGSRYSEGELRLRVVDSKKINPDSFMPGFYKTTGLHRVQKKYQGKTMLSAQQVEDVVAYMMTLRDDTPFNKAFSWARQAKLNMFEWKGKIYTTGLKK